MRFCPFAEQWYTVAMDTQASSVLDEFLDPLARSLPVEAARIIASFRASPQTQARIDELADKCNEGSLTAEERHEYEDYVDAIDFVAILQAKAREALKDHVSP
jgi:hypothetical protein